MNINIRRLYLYGASLIGLILIIIASVSLVNLGLKTWVFTKADDNFYCERTVKIPAPVAEGDESAVLAGGRAEAFPEGEKVDCDEQRTARRQRDASNSVAMLIVGMPLYLYHWNKVKSDKNE